MSDSKNDILFLEADQLINAGRMGEAMPKLQEIINDDPAYARAHNHLGWIFDTQIYKPKQAEEHFKHAIKFDPAYASPYLNYLELLFIQRRFDEAHNIILKAMGIPTINKSRVFFMKGRLHELQGEYDKAIECYKLAGGVSCDVKTFETVEQSIARCEKKKTALL